jgi:hypothetical protein
VSDAVRAHNVAASYIVNTAGPNYFETPAEILEIHNTYGDTIRTIADNPDFFGDNLVSTNHFRLLKPPASCYRYSRIADSLQNSNLFDINRNWTVLKAAGVNTNLQTIQYIPSMHLLRFSFAETGTPAYMIEPTELHVDSLFALVGINDLQKKEASRVHISPNPCSSHTHIKIDSRGHGTFKCTIFDLAGKMVYETSGLRAKDESCTIRWDTGNLPDGVYFCRIDLYDEKAKPFSESQKIVIAK